MARKVLLSFLGTGIPETTNGYRPMRKYRQANYKIDGTTHYDIPFMSAALKEHYEADQILMIGTVHSMWEEVYRWFHDRNSKTKVEDSDETYDIYDEIGTYCEKADHKADLYIPYHEKIEAEIGGKVILIKYGITEEEIRENITRILSLQQYLNNGDELIVDITHSFRSLPIFIMNLLIYLKNVSSKNITISHIHYGMIEVRSELGGYAPVVDLKAMMDVQEWITGAYAFSEFGNAYKISKLLEKHSEDTNATSAAPILRDFSDAMNLNYLYSMQGVTQKLMGIREKSYVSDFANQIISPVVKDFVTTFDVSQSLLYPQSIFQLKLADWQFKHKKYGQAYLTSHDALITYVCEKNEWMWTNFEHHGNAKKLLMGNSVESAIFIPTAEMRNWYELHNKCRNGIAHTTKVLLNKEQTYFIKKITGKKRDKLSVKDMIEILREYIKYLKTIIV